MRRPFVLLLFACAISSCVSTGAVAAGAASELEEVPISESERLHWAYQPMAAVEPPAIDDPAWSKNPIDSFMRRAWDRESIKPLPEVGRETLLRRVSFDLTGLPPSPEEIEQFLADDSPGALKRVVDRLLASPAYGERYAQHWLDLARFAETDGFEHDLVRPNAWRYRDWVIDALNRDLPYDEFVRLQLAGDELQPGDPEAAVATGFLLCGPDMPDINLQEERRHVVLNEMTSTVGSALLAMQFGCAQCHDHKYDPIRIQDFYRLRAFFESAEIFRDHPIPTAEQLAARRAVEKARGRQYDEAIARRKQLEALGRKRLREQDPDERPTRAKILERLTDQEAAEYRQADELIKNAPPLPQLPLGRVMKPGKPNEAFVYLRGDFRQPGPLVDCSFPEVLSEQISYTAENFKRPRAELAHWITQSEHPLTARVIVNRLWQWHFGRGLVATPSDFGTMGSEPADPELLDWLARRLVADGWSLKSMHRLMVTSRAYRVAAVPYDAEWTEEQINIAKQRAIDSAAADPDNDLFWHRPLARLDGEAIRDAMLAAAGKLSPRSGGPGIRPPLAPEITSTLLKNQWKVSGDEEDHRRRSIYLFVRRNLRYPMFDVFDRPDTNASCAVRHESTTATQSLTQFNSAFSLDCARWLAGAVWPAEEENAKAAESEAIRQAYLRVLNRSAKDDEIAAGRAFLAKQAGQLRDEGRAAEALALPLDGERSADPYLAAALVDYCLALFNTNEFLYLE